MWVYIWTQFSPVDLYVHLLANTKLFIINFNFMVIFFFLIVILFIFLASLHQVSPLIQYWIEMVMAEILPVFLFLVGKHSVLCTKYDCSSRLFTYDLISDCGNSLLILLCWELYCECWILTCVFLESFGMRIAFSSLFW